MKNDNMDLKHYTGGWLVGDFEPSIFRRKDIEVGVKILPLGFRDKAHYHLESTEYNFILNGKLETETGELVEKGGCFIYRPGEVSRTSVLEDNTVVLVIRDGSNVDDKYDAE